MCFLFIKLDPLIDHKGKESHFSDHWKNQAPDKCPVTSVWDAPTGWPEDKVPSFYLSVEDLSCVDQSGTSSTSSGRVGFSCGSPFS